MMKAMLHFGTKAETLERVAPHLKTARVTSQLFFSVREWWGGRSEILKTITERGWGDRALAVRSSAQHEDGKDASQAGRFSSVLNVEGKEAIEQAVESVIASYDDRAFDHHILIQPMVQNAIMSGVAFSKEQSSGAPYIVVNYDDTTGKTNSVTGGQSNAIKTFYCFREYHGELPTAMMHVVALIRELEDLFKTDAIDIEFALTQENELYLLQVRPLVCKTQSTVSATRITETLQAIEQKAGLLSKPHPYLDGSRTLFGIMPDWNPAEMIGVRPRPLALSLYKDLITDSMWAYQRNNYGYKNLRSFPLMVHFMGLPYIDVRVDFNSFIPANLPPSVGEKLVNYYIDRLAAFPSFHDKIEFEIVFSCYTFDLQERLRALRNVGFAEEDMTLIAEHLRTLTNGIIRKDGLWHKDWAKITELERRQMIMMESDLDPVGKIYWLLEDCKRYGTLPFAGLARAGFIAVQLLRSLVAVNIVTEQEADRFMGSLELVNGQMARDVATLSRDAFLQKYGHLRPGTYDVLSARYDEAPDHYFDWSKREKLATEKHEPFALTLQQIREIERYLREHGLEHDVLGLFDFMKGAIEGREYAKFVFTKSVSEMLRIVKTYGASLGFSPEDVSYMNIRDIYTLYDSSVDHRTVLARSIAAGYEQYELGRSIILPPLMLRPEDVWAFQVPTFDPNFVTRKMAAGRIVQVYDDRATFTGNIVCIPSADPGYDWIFSHGISGFITMYGGVNSHMAIRAAELGIPAVIGAGETLFNQWSKAGRVEIDCVNRQVRVI